MRGRGSGALAELLDDPGRLAAMVADPDVLGGARDVVETAAAEAVELGGWTSDDPLRLSKGPVTWLLRCPRRALADTEAATGNPDDLAIGLLIDAGAKLVTLRPSQAVTVESALGFLTATGDESVREHLELVGVERAAEVVTEAQARLDVLLDGWPQIEGAWWPRVEEPVRARLAGGAVVFSGRLDVLLGGPPTELPALIVEVKSGRWHDAVRSDGHLYGLLLGLRDGVPPAAVLSIAAGDGATQLEPIRAEVLGHAAERVAEAMRVAARLAAGESPPAHPGSHCTYCPLRSACPEARAAAA
jgi:hypothetical protein